MDKLSFALLSLEDKQSILNKEGEFLYEYYYDGLIVRFYALYRFWVEEYRSKITKEIVKIESIAGKGEHRKNEFYEMRLTISSDGIRFKTDDEVKAKLYCYNCEFEWYPEGSEKFSEICCPICDLRKITFLFPHVCRECNVKYHSQPLQYLKRCPSCTEKSQKD